MNGTLKGDMSPLVPDDKSTPSAEGAAVATKGSSAKSKKKKKTIDSMVSLIEAVLQNRRLNLTENILRKLRDSPIGEHDRARLLASAAEQDSTLELARVFMHAAVQAFSHRKIAGFFNAFAKDLIFQHPKVGALGAELLPDSPDIRRGKFTAISKRLCRLRDEAIQKLKSEAGGIPRTESDALEFREFRKKVAKDECILYENLMFSTALWWHMYRLAEMDEIVSVLSSELFPCKLEDREIQVEILSLLQNTNDKKAFGAFFHWHKDMVDDLRSRNEALSIDIQRKEYQAEILKNRVEEFSTLNNKLSLKIDDLEQVIIKEKNERKNEKIHLLDTIERQKSHTKCTIEADLKLLSDALTAMKREPPKTNIAINYIETVIESMNAEMNFLKEA